MTIEEKRQYFIDVEDLRVRGLQTYAALNGHSHWAEAHPLFLDLSGWLLAGSSRVVLSPASPFSVDYILLSEIDVVVVVKSNGA